jgi:hypothetical protein
MDARGSFREAASASFPGRNIERREKPLRWRLRAGEDKRGFCRQNPRGPKREDPKAQVKPRAKGVSVSHERSNGSDGDSEARANHESGRGEPVTALSLPGGS